MNIIVSPLAIEGNPIPYIIVEGRISLEVNRIPDGYIVHENDEKLLVESIKTANQWMKEVFGYDVK